tara:strand:- start:69 stop:296 length:228 start_codon:yes stop_codon:yes gene_type:complete
MGEVRAFIAIIYMMIGLGSGISLVPDDSGRPILHAIVGVYLWPVTFGVSISESINADREALRLYREVAEHLKGSE